MLVTQLCLAQVTAVYHLSYFLGFSRTLTPLGRLHAAHSGVQTLL
jgi:hypothetical protein